MNFARRVRSIHVALGLVLVASVGLALPASGEPSSSIPEAEICARLQIDQFHLVQLTLPDDGSESIVTALPLDNVEYQLILDTYSLRSPAFAVLVAEPDGVLTEAPAPPPCTYRGTLAERPDSQIAATLTNGQLTALILCSDRMWGLQPLAGIQDDADPATHVVYRLEDLRPIEADVRTDMLLPPGRPKFADDGEPSAHGGPRDLPCSLVCEIAFDADYEFYRLSGSSVANTVADIEQVLNGLEFIYERDTQIVYELTTVIVREAEPDPYTSNDPYTLLEQFRSEWRHNQSAVVRDTAHLMTGKFLTGDVVGLAWVGVICDLDYGYGLSRSRFTNNMVYRVGLTAHEVGHNWDAEHCDGDEDCFIMCSMLGGCARDLTRFGSRSISAIEWHRDSRTCLTEDGPRILTQPTPYQLVCAGDVAVLSVSVDEPLVGYQWRRGSANLVDDGTHIVGATSRTLAILNVTEADAASDYNCVVTDLVTECDSVSDYAEIAVDTDVPVITQQPEDQTVTEGELASFHIAVAPPGFVDYQWRKDGAPLSDDGRVMGATTNMLIIYPVELTDEGEYDCIVTSQTGGQCSTTSDTATLTVEANGNDCPEDLNGDRRVDLQDLSQLLAHYGTTSGANPEDGDIDRDGDVDLQDLTQLLAMYGQECPAGPMRGFGIERP